MAKLVFDATPHVRLLFPLPVLLVSCIDGQGNANIITISAGSLMCANPVVFGIAVAQGHYSHGLIKDSGQFVINVPGEDLLAKADYCGTVSGRKVNKFDECSFTTQPGTKVKAPVIEQCPINIECEVTDVMPLGSHDWFTAAAKAVHIDERLIHDKERRLNGEVFNSPVFLTSYYRSLGKPLGKVGFSVRKRKEEKECL